jgi:hypothetical protein
MVQQSDSPMANPPVTLDTIFDYLKALGQQLTTRMDAIEARMYAVEVKLDAVEVKLDGLEVKMDALEVEMDALKVKMDAPVTLSTILDYLKALDHKLTVSDDTLRFDCTTEFTKCQKFNAGTDSRLLAVEVFSRVKFVPISHVDSVWESC